MEVLILGEVTNDKKEKIEIEITEIDIERLIIEKAKERGIKGYKGRIFKHYDETIRKVITRW